jgi:hypothetical protein
VPVHIEGTLARIQARADVEKLEQQLQKGLAAKNTAAQPDEAKKEPKTKTRRARGPQGL